MEAKEAPSASTLSCGGERGSKDTRQGGWRDRLLESHQMPGRPLPTLNRGQKRKRLEKEEEDLSPSVECRTGNRRLSTSSTRTHKDDDDREASGHYPMKYSEEELQMRRGKMGSTLSIIDRQKFAREFDPSMLSLSRPAQEIYRCNPHLQQAFANRREQERFSRPGRSLMLSDRIVRFPEEVNPTPTTKYQRRQGEAKTVEHWGQRKLLLSEIEFLTTYGHLASTIVYAGAAPGKHTNFLAERLFPNHRWILVDPARFEATPIPQKIEIRREFFTNAMAQEFAGEDILFISDVRSMTESMSEEEKEQCVRRDMEAQARWVQIMRPKATMLKFRLPYTPGRTVYLDGRLHLPVWGGRTTSESRLVIVEPPAREQIRVRQTKKEEEEEEEEEERAYQNNSSTDCSLPTRVYCHSWYEDLMFHHNTVTRTTYFEHQVCGEGIDHCFDCASELLILANYLRSEHRGMATVDEEALGWTVAGLSFLISRQLSAHRTLKLA